MNAVLEAQERARKCNEMLAQIKQAQATASLPKEAAPVTTTNKVEEKPVESVNSTLFVDPMPDFPASLKSMPRWVRWKIAQVNGRYTKVPYTVDGRMAASTRSEDWTTYEQAVAGVTLSEKNGVGFVVDGSIVGVDIDGCRNPETGEITEWAQSIIDLLDSYTEVTPSKTGVRIWVRGTIPQKKNRFAINPNAGCGNKVGVECYSDARYFTVTGECIQFIPSDAQPRDLTTLYVLLEKIQEQHPLAKKETKPDASGAVTSTVQIEHVGNLHTTKYDIFMHGDVISASPFVIATPMGKLEYPSHSEADFAFATVLAYYHKGDIDKMAEDFRASKSMYRPEKWDRLEDATFEKVLASIDLTDEQQTIPNIPPIAATPEPEITEEEVNAALDEEYPVIPLGEYSGPAWEDEWMYGIAGEITRKAAKYCEAHPAGMYLDFLISIGSIIGRGPYFNTSATRHYTNEFMIRVGNTATARKGTGRDAVDEPLKMVDPNWFQNRVMSGFGSGEAIVHQIADSSTHSVYERKTRTFKGVVKPGVADKRLCVREGEAASIYQLAGKKESRADIIIRDGWDSKPLKNIVKGATEGINNSGQCQEPHLSISGDTTRSELLRRLPEGSDQNGFGNRFLYCYVQRVKLCPLGGPPIDWTEEVKQLHEIIAFARSVSYVPLSRAAAKVWVRMYTEMEQELAQMPALSQAMCSRGVAHVRRLALIFALLDKKDAVDTVHLHAAKRLWDYCQESARFIFDGTTKDQERIASWVARQQRPVTVREVTDEVFHRNVKVGWVKNQLDGLVAGGRMATSDGETYQKA